MRWNDYEYGDRRETREFLLWPRKIGGQNRWFEWATIRQVKARDRWNDAYWKDEAWIDEGVPVPTLDHLAETVEKWIIEECKFTEHKGLVIDIALMVSSRLKAHFAGRVRIVR